MLYPVPSIFRTNNCIKHVQYIVPTKLIFRIKILYVSISILYFLFINIKIIFVSHFVNQLLHKVILYYPIFYQNVIYILVGKKILFYKIKAPEINGIFTQEGKLFSEYEIIVM